MLWCGEYWYLTVAQGNWNWPISSALVRSPIYVLKLLHQIPFLTQNSDRDDITQLIIFVKMMWLFLSLESGHVEHAAILEEVGTEYETFFSRL